MNTIESNSHNTVNKNLLSEESCGICINRFRSIVSEIMNFDICCMNETKEKLDIFAISRPLACEHVVKNSEIQLVKYEL